MREGRKLSQSFRAHRWRGAVAAFVLASLAACANWPAQNDTPDTGELLRNSLPVAAAALAAGQVDVARRLYLSLSKRFDAAPEPFLGLGYIAFQSGDSVAAETYFVQAAERAVETPALRAEALLGAGRTALVQGKPNAARRHFRDAKASARDTPSAAWIANGLAVTSVLDSDYEAAEAHYGDALRLSSGNPRIAANFIRMLVATGRIDDAARTFAQHPPSHWPDDDGAVLSRLIEEARRQRRVEALTNMRTRAPTPAATDGVQTRDDAASGQTDSGVPPVRPSAAPSTRSEQEVPDLAPPRRLDPDLAMRLYLSDALPAQRNADKQFDAQGAPSAPLMLQFDGWPKPLTPPTAGDDAASNPAGSAVSPIPSASPSLPVTPLFRPPAATGPRAADIPVPSPRLPEQKAAEFRSLASVSESASPQSGSTVAAPESVARPPDSIASAPESGSPRPDSAAPDSRLSGPETSAPRVPAAPAAFSAAQPYGLPESDAVSATPLDHSPTRTLTLSVGQSQRMHLERDATTVLVASPEIADVQLLAPNVLYVIGKGVGRTSVAVLNDNEQIEERVVSVVLDLEPLRTILAAEPDLRGVRARRLSRGMVLTGEVASAASVDRALRLAAGALPEGVTIENDLRIATLQQVNLEVQIAEVSRLVTEELGVNWESFGAEGSGRFGFRIGRPFPPPTSDAPPGLDGFPPWTIDGNPASSIFLGSQGPRGQFRLMIDALATAGLANVLARPNVTAISGESASFFSGGERPIPTGYDSRTETIIFEYKKVGVLLDFVPTVVDTGRIVLTVRPEVSEPDASQPLAIGPVLLPVINVRRAETTVEVGDGESIVIAGLFRNRSNSLESGLPVLKDVPLFGMLFGRTSVRSDELELIVVVTARLVQAEAASDETVPPAEMLQVNGYRY